MGEEGKEGGGERWEEERGKEKESGGREGRKRRERDSSRRERGRVMERERRRRRERGSERGRWGGGGGLSLPFFSPSLPPSFPWRKGKDRQTRNQSLTPPAQYFPWERT